MGNPTCIADECGDPSLSRGLCSAHYNRARRAGNIEAVALPKRAAPAISDIDEDARTCTCALHGPGSTLRIRQPEDRRGRLSCRRCARGKSRTTPEKRREYRRESKYGLTSAEYEIRLGGQQGLCLICRDPLGDNVVVDHDHEGGHVRGLLCRECNLGLGFFRDNPEAMLRAAKYVRRYRLAG